MASYRVYCKLPGKKRFYPVGEDADGNLCISGNLLSAFIYDGSTPEKLDKIKRFASELERDNPGLKAELREVKW